MDEAALKQRLDTALAERPAFKPTASFQRDWDRWKVTLRRSIAQLEERAPAGADSEDVRGVLEVFKILNGDGPSALAPAHREESWIPVLGAELAYNRPGAVADERDAW